MLRQLVLGILIVLILPKGGSAIVLQGYNVEIGDEFAFKNDVALFREYSNDGVVNERNGFEVYGVFIEEFRPFIMEIDSSIPNGYISVNLDLNEVTYRLTDHQQFFVHTSDWDSYLTDLAEQKLIFDGKVLNDELSGSFDIIDAETEIGYRLEYVDIRPLEGTDYINQSRSEVVRFERSSGVIWERYNDTRIESYFVQVQFIDVYRYAFQRDVEYVVETSRVIIPGFGLIISMVCLFTVVGLKKRFG